MSVTAQLHVKAGRRRVFQISRHDLRRAPVERERRDHHAPVTDGHEIGITGGVLLLEQRDRIRAIARWFPSGMAGRTNLVRAALPRARRSSTLRCAILLTAHAPLLIRCGRELRTRSTSPGLSQYSKTARAMFTSLDGSKIARASVALSRQWARSAEDVWAEVQAKGRRWHQRMSPRERRIGGNQTLDRPGIRILMGQELRGPRPPPRGSAAYSSGRTGIDHASQTLEIR